MTAIDQLDDLHRRGIRARVLSHHPTATPPELQLEVDLVIGNVAEFLQWLQYIGAAPVRSTEPRIPLVQRLLMFQAPVRFVTAAGLLVIHTGKVSG